MHIPKLQSRYDIAVTGIKLISKYWWEYLSKLPMKQNIAKLDRKLGLNK